MIFELGWIGYSFVFLSLHHFAKTYIPVLIYIGHVSLDIDLVHMIMHHILEHISIYYANEYGLTRPSCLDLLTSLCC